MRDLTYDDYGRIRTASNGRGVTATTSYDTMDRVLRTDFTDGTWVSYGYDDAGRLGHRYDAYGTTDYTYDQLGRLVRRENSHDGGLAFSYRYDKASRLVESTTTTGDTISYSYDKAGVLSSLTYPYQGSTKKMVFYVDSQSRRTEAFLGSNDARTEWVAHYKYTYNKNDQVIRVLAEQGSGTASNSDIVDTTYCYKTTYNATTAPAGIKPGSDCTLADTVPQLSKLQWKKDNLTGVVTEYAYTKAGRLDTVKSTLR